MKNIYCSECGKKLEIIRKPMPLYNTIVEMVNPHVCSEEPVNELELKPDPVPPFVVVPKFVQKLNDLGASKLVNPEGGDKRPPDQLRKEITSTAPTSVIDRLKSGKTEE